jgi:hypothetical protein
MRSRRSRSKAAHEGEKLEEDDEEEEDGGDGAEELGLVRVAPPSGGGGGPSPVVGGLLLLILLRLLRGAARADGHVVGVVVRVCVVGCWWCVDEAAAAH